MKLSASFSTRVISAIAPALALGALLAAAPVHAALFVPISATDTIITTGGNWDDATVTSSATISTLTGATYNYAPAFNLSGFTLFGTAVDPSLFRINTNGWLNFSATTPGSTWNNDSYAFPSTTSVAIAPFWDDLYITGATTGLAAADKNIRANNTVAGQYTVTWKNVEGYQDTASSLTFQATMLGIGNAYGSVPGTIVFSYGALTPGTKTYTFTSGVNAGNGTTSLVTPGYTGATNGSAAMATLQNAAYTFTPNGTGGYTASFGAPVVVPEAGTFTLALTVGLPMVGGLILRRSNKHNAA